MGDGDYRHIDDHPSHQPSEVSAHLDGVETSRDS